MHTHNGPESSPRNSLETCIESVCTGDWQMIQLRGRALGPHNIDGDDVDLLTSPASVKHILDAACEWVKQGLCHLRINSRRSDKVELSLFSKDGLHKVTLDLWINLWQLDNGNQCLTFSDCLSFIDVDRTSIQRLPIDLEACIYLQHLETKGRDVANPKALARLQFYADGCQQAGSNSISQNLRDISKAQSISSQQAKQTFEHIASTLSLTPRTKIQKIFSKLNTHIWEARLAAPTKTRLISIMGCDGAGKTTLANALRRKMPNITSVFTGKHLYRKSFIHKGAVIFIRPLMFQSRENFDEKLAPLVYLRACFGQYLRYWRTSSGITLIDRSIIDFLYLNRKTNHPTFSVFTFLSKIWGQRMPTIHCIVSYATIAERKLEITKVGHAKYNNDMYQHFSQRRPTDYVAFNNELSLAESTSALASIIATFSANPNPS